ncbi:uncharacterized protein EV422DRAFT_603512 [Fimicolochytrium jonesii]|uniref:uncharacterized protein n=1 Tax=Fimicolochytrium jonesii TaxID=1396493 RepID=UPI0022FE8CA9|nr:uncharacterized protein EV422DRAFT_603512 [Fimicolochytrium jonesii]KAI8817784.1 hypothetical protein EV422DRAFT_603512 [Fimicolochytrium jonesii]
MAFPGTPAFFGSNDWRDTRPLFSDTQEDNELSEHDSSDGHSACACATESAHARIDAFLARSQIEHAGVKIGLYGAISHVDAEVLVGLLQFCTDMGISFDSVCEGLADGTLDRVYVQSLKFALDAHPAQFALREFANIVKTATVWRLSRDRYHAGPHAATRPQSAPSNNPTSRPPHRAGAIPSAPVAAAPLDGAVSQQDLVTLMFRTLEQLQRTPQTTNSQASLNKGLPKYEGNKYHQDSSRILQWLRTFDKLADSCGVQEKDRFRWLSKAIDDKDQLTWTWFTSYQGNTQDWNHVRTDMVLECASSVDRDPSLLADRISTFQRAPGQTIRQYGSLFLSLVYELEYLNKHIATVATELTRTQIARAFIRGLGDSATLAHALGLPNFNQLPIEELIRACADYAERKDAYSAPNVPYQASTRPSYPAPTATNIPGTNNQYPSNARNQRPSVPRAQPAPRVLQPAPQASAPTTSAAPAASGPDDLTARMRDLSIKTAGNSNQYPPGLPSARPQRRDRACFRGGQSGHIFRDCQSTTKLDTWHGYQLAAAFYPKEVHEYDEDHTEYYSMVLRDVGHYYADPEDQDFPNGSSEQ